MRSKYCKKPQETQKHKNILYEVNIENKQHNSSNPSSRLSNNHQMSLLKHMTLVNQKNEDN